MVGKKRCAGSEVATQCWEHASQSRQSLPLLFLSHYLCRSNVTVQNQPEILVERQEDRRYVDPRVLPNPDCFTVCPCDVPNH